jgi:hypothetical protein
MRRTRTRKRKMNSSTLIMRRVSMKRSIRSSSINTESSMKRRRKSRTRKRKALMPANRIMGIVGPVNLVKLMLSD